MTDDPYYHLKKACAQRLHDHMIAKGLKQSDLARKLGLTEHTISGFCSAQSLPTQEILIKLADALDLHPDELVPPGHYNAGSR